MGKNRKDPSVVQMRISYLLQYWVVGCLSGCMELWVLGLDRLFALSIGGEDAVSRTTICWVDDGWVVVSEGGEPS